MSDFIADNTDIGDNMVYIMGDFIGYNTDIGDKYN